MVDALADPVESLADCMPQRWPITVDFYHRMIKAGLFSDGERVELLDGELIQMAPIGSYHFFCVNALAQWFILRLEGRAEVGIQGPVQIPRYNEPEPDLSILRLRPDRYSRAVPAPEDVYLLIEVADTTFPRDRDKKLPLYAAAGIPEYWIFDIPRSRVIACSEPLGDGYEQIRTIRGGQTLSSAAFPDLVLVPGEIFEQIKRDDR